MGLDLRSTLKNLGLLAGNEVLARSIARNRQEHAPRATSKWWRIANATDGETAELWIYDYIDMWGVTAAQFAEDLRSITAPNITVRINSPGGDVFDGIAIMNALRSHPANVTTRVDALAASIASVIAQGGDHRVMVQHSKMMIHEASGMMWGNADEMRAFADLLDKVSDGIAGIYADRSGDGHGDTEAFRALMIAETWLTPEQTVDLGLADEVEVPAGGNPDKPSSAAEDEGDDDPDEGDDEEEDPAPDEDAEARARNRAAWLQVLPNATRAAQELPV